MAAGYGLPSVPAVLINALPFLALLSIAWTAWDPTYASLKRSQLQGREVRQRGKKEYNVRDPLNLQQFSRIRLISVSVDPSVPRVVRTSRNSISYCALVTYTLVGLTAAHATRFNIRHLRLTRLYKNDMVLSCITRPRTHCKFCIICTFTALIPRICHRFSLARYSC